jgi:hypothetical protein
MEYLRITDIDDPHFADMHRLLARIFPPEEVLAFPLWKEPLQDPDIHVYVAVHEGEVVGATEYRYNANLRVAMTDFTVIGKAGLGIGRFLYKNRMNDLRRLEQQSGTVSIGMFAEIYNPQHNMEFRFGEVLPMHPAVRREVLSHLGYNKIDFPYVHPSWDHEGKAVTGLDLGFLPADEERKTLPAGLIVSFLRWYYEALPNKPQEWHDMIADLESRREIPLIPL